MFAGPYPGPTFHIGPSLRPRPRLCPHAALHPQLTINLGPMYSKSRTYITA